ncbi:hypothetical protein BVRB_7g169390 [Beta vulgaris subsp. vulgaris]|nr:hypothetical protein BVRB_7g169390 [Beta vulgaris subsp. vulgaris]
MPINTHKVATTELAGPGFDKTGHMTVAGLIWQEKSDSSTTEDEGESSSLASKLGKVGAAVAGAAVVGWGVLKLFNELSSDYQQQHKYKTKSPWNSIVDTTHNRSSESYQYNDHYTLNYSGSDINQLHEGGAGCIIRNKQGDLVIAAAYNLDSLYLDQFHVAIAEAIAWKRGLELAKTKKVKLDLIKGDNEEVINRVRGREKKPPQVPLLSDYIIEIREGLNEQSIDPKNQVNWIKSEDNEIANELASLGSKLESELVQTYMSDEELPYKVAMLIEQDKYKLRAQKFLM